MFKVLKIICVCISLCACTDNHSTSVKDANQELISMSCENLMLELIEGSSFKAKFHDKKLGLEFYFERSDEGHILIKFVQRAGSDINGIYANVELDLNNQTLNIIDPEIPIPIKFNQDYIPLVAKKCTPDQDLYGNTGRLPDKDFDHGN